MKKTWSVISGVGAVAAAPLFALAWPALIFSGAAVSLYHQLSKARPRRLSWGQACAIDADCPPGFVCVNGQCILQEA